MAKVPAYKRRRAARKAARSRWARRSTVHFLIGAFCVLAVIGWVMNLFDKDDKHKAQEMNINVKQTEFVPAKRTPTPTPYHVYYDKDKTDTVMEIQNRLIELGFYEGEANGNYDTATAQAIKDFQLVQFMPETGIADDETIEKLFFKYIAPNVYVFVSSNGIYHTNSTCSGMKNYTTMKLSEAMRKGYTRHKCN